MLAGSQEEKKRGLAQTKPTLETGMKEAVPVAGLR